MFNKTKISKKRLRSESKSLSVTQILKLNFVIFLYAKYFAIRRSRVQFYGQCWEQCDSIAKLFFIICYLLQLKCAQTLYSFCQSRLKILRNTEVSQIFRNVWQSVQIWPNLVTLVESDIHEFSKWNKINFGHSKYN